LLKDGRQDRPAARPDSTQLLTQLDKLFQRQSLERNIYIFNQMKPNLEIPISLIAKERKVLAITTDEKLVLQVHTPLT
jgi:hypothetical protein